MGKDEFLLKCLEHGIPPENAAEAWRKLQTLEDHIRKNWKVFKIMQQYPKGKRLKLREFAAEHGYEYTPDELDKLIKTIGLIQENMDDEKTGF